MNQRVFALIDCNNFFASCERVFNPALINKPIAILSNNDGCIIARSSETKKLGIPMGAPFHKYKDTIEKHHVHIFSANFHLYGDMSNRVMQILQRFAPDVQIYSIDEAFLDLTHVKILDYHAYAKEIRDTILKWTGLPVSVGIAPTKTLAKIATEEAKHNEDSDGTYIFHDSAHIDTVLKKLPVGEIWGIGWNLTEYLHSLGIYTAYDFTQCDERWVRNTMSVTVQRTLFELRGIHCIEGVENKETKKQIISSRSFSYKVSSLEELKQSVASYVGRAAEKLRKQNSICSYVGVMITTGKHNKNQEYYTKSAFRSLDTPTDYTPDIITKANECLEEIYRKGYYYKKSLIMLNGIIPKDSQTISLFKQDYDTKTYGNVMQAFDRINKAWGSDTIKIAAMGTKQKWKAKSNLRSPRFTTNWDELPKVK